MSVVTPQQFPNVSSQPIVNSQGLITEVFRQFLQSLWLRTGGSSGAGGVQSGLMADWPSSAVPSGWLECDGAEVSRSTYANLFNAIGTVWGVGDGSTTFNLPNLSGRMAIGVGGGFSLAQTGGATFQTVSKAQLPSYALTVTDPGHTHVVTDPGHTHTVIDPDHTHTVTDPGHVHTVTDPGHMHTAPEISNDVTVGLGIGGVVAGNTGSATTGITINSATTGVTNQSAATGVTNQSNTTGVTNQSHVTGISVASGGSGNPLSTISPYAAVLKIIKT